MTQPLALVVYEKLLPGTQLVNRLQDLHYRVQVVTDPDTLENCAQQEKPMLVLADLRSSRKDVPQAIGCLKKNPATWHIPVIAFTGDEDQTLHEAGLAAGAALVVSETVILNHLEQFLEQALRVE